MHPEGFNVRPYRMKRLKDYCSRMSKDNETIIFDDNVADMLRLQGYQWDETPRSLYSVDKLYTALSAYSPNKEPVLNLDADSNAGYSLAYRCFAKPKILPYLSVLPMTPQTVSMITSNDKASAGLTNWGCTKAESQTRALERGIQTLRREKAPEPCLAFKRTQFDDKTRLVWGYPYSMTVIEGLLARPLIDHFKLGTTPMAFGITTMALGSKLRVSSYHRDWAYSLDMSQFDATIHSKLIGEAFSILRTWFNPKEVEPITGLTVRQIFNTIEHYFIRTPIVMPDGNIYLGKRHGVPSGSYFTQIIDSIVNVRVIGSVAEHFNMRVGKGDVYVLGDDIMIWSDRDVNLDDISRYANRVFGVKLHGKEKSAQYESGETLHFLGRDWTDGIPNLSTEKIIARMVFPERFRKYSKSKKKREHEVRMLVMSFATQYYAAWDIARNLYGPRRWDRFGGEALDRLAYDGHEDVDPNYLSGLERYQRLYVRKDNRGIKTTAGLFWL